MSPSRQRWIELCTRLESAPELQQWYQQLEKRYSERQRHYHTFHHIADCLSQFDLAPQLATNPLAVETAIWFHDAIYNPHASDNEQRSAELSGQFLDHAGPIGQRLKPEVTALILATRHDAAPFDPDSCVMIDVDLSILGQPEGSFTQYEAQIRAEYSWVPGFIFAAKRAEILERFLARPRIYSTEFFQVRYEKQARENLKSSIEKLRG